MAVGEPSGPVGEGFANDASAGRSAEAAKGSWR